MRIETRDLADKNRVPLWEVVPLPGPLNAYVDISNRCNFKCVYCPTGHPDMLRAAGRTQQHMPLEMYKKVLHDLGEFPKLPMMNLYKDGDGLVRKDFTYLVQLARDADVAVKIYSKTNGELIRYHKDLAAAPLDMLGLSVPGVNEDAIAEVVGHRVNYQRYRDGVKALFEDSRRRFTINAKMARYKMTDADIEKFYRDFEPICDTVAIEGLHGWGNNEAGDMFLEDNGPHDGVPINYKIACPLPFYLMSVSSNGIVNTCCAEWGNYHHHGDIMRNSLKGIWEGERLRAFQIMHLEGRKSENPACRSCQYTHCLPDNINDHREEMLARLNGGNQ